MKKILIVAITLATCWAFSNTVTAQDEWGHLSGQVVVEGKAPAPQVEPVGDHADKPVCLVDGEIPVDDNVVINEEGNGLRDVYVMMYQKKPSPVPTHPDYEEKKAEPVVVDNVKCRFVPQAAFVRPGQKLILKNSDPVGHNFHIHSFNNEKNINLPANDQLEIVLDENDKTVSKIVCDLHGWMNSTLMIRDNPYVAITDEEGKFTIENIPAGEWKFQFYHKEGGWLKKLEVPDDRKVGRKGDIEVKIANGETNDLGEMKIAIDQIVKPKK